MLLNMLQRLVARHAPETLAPTTIYRNATIEINHNEDPVTDHANSSRGFCEMMRNLMVRSERSPVLYYFKFFLLTLCNSDTGGWRVTLPSSTTMVC